MEVNMGQGDNGGKDKRHTDTSENEERTFPDPDKRTPCISYRGTELTPPLSCGDCDKNPNK